MAYNNLQKLQHNMVALDIALHWEEGQKLAPVQIDQLKRYSGFGGLKAILFPFGSLKTWEAKHASKADMDLYAPFMELHRMLEKTLGKDLYKSAIDASIKKN